MSIRNQRGQGLIEYVLLVALIGVATTLMVRKLQSTVNVNMARVVDSLQSKGRKRFHFESVNEDDVKMKDFGNFMNGTGGRSNDGE